jgi:hypothetical protein
MADEPGNGGATPPAAPTPDGATPDGLADGGATPPDGGDDPKLRDPGKAALDKEREARRDAERRASEAQARLQALEDEGKSEIERAISRLDRQSAELDQERTLRQQYEHRLAEMELLELKRSVAIEAGLPPDAAHRLIGTDVRSLKADAQRYLDERGKPAADLGVGRGGAASGRGVAADMNQLIREASGRTS